VGFLVGFIVVFFKWVFKKKTGGFFWIGFFYNNAVETASEFFKIVICFAYFLVFLQDIKLN